MQAANIPAKLAKAFAANAGAGYIRTIPADSQIATVPGAASLNDGFVPLNFLPTASGGIPPDGRDVNGILNIISAWSQWQNMGGQVTYDAAFSALIGGYPKGARLNMLSGAGQWVSLADDNTDNPETGMSANWMASPLVAPSGDATSWVDYQVNGWIEQGGYVVTALGSGISTITFPVPFPTRCVRLEAIIDSDAISTTFLTSAIISATTGTVHAASVSGAGIVAGVRYTAKGY